MPRYFFHLTSTHDVPDSIGSEHETLASAKCHAVKMIADVLCKEPEAYWKSEMYRVTVSDEDRLVVFSVEMISVDAPVLKA